MNGELAFSRAKMPGVLFTQNYVDFYKIYIYTYRLIALHIFNLCKGESS